jgi:hypothetical protein
VVQVKCIMEIKYIYVFAEFFFAVLEYGFCSAVPALKYVFSLAVGVFKLTLCCAANRKFLMVIKYVLPITEFYWRNDKNRSGGSSRCFDSFWNSPGESSMVILNKSPI